MESRLGFISSYNFIPCGYQTPEEIRKRLNNSGFEVGVHGLTHDGRLFLNYKNFFKVIPEINRFLKEWDAIGFTSPSMLTCLKWIADLNIEYSCSSFDTDPFEPRPFGVATIYPFYVSNVSNSRTYVELPYTLPQDHSLFLLLGQKNIKIWKDKLDWVAEKGGVALLNTHPDYMNFESNKYSYDKYPASHYFHLLEYVRIRYSGQYWNCLPASLARFWRTHYPRI